jgi:hypothetical protein
MTFDLKSFLKTVLIFALFSIAWTMLSMHFERFTEKDKFLITGFGYIIIFASSFYFGRKLKPFYYLVLLIVAAVGMFLFASFILLIFAEMLGVMCYGIISSAFTSFFLILILDKFYGIHRKYVVLLVTACFGSIAYYLQIEFKGEIKMHGTFNIYQSFLLVPLAAGLSWRKTKD